MSLHCSVASITSFLKKVRPNFLAKGLAINIALENDRSEYCESATEKSSVLSSISVSDVSRDASHQVYQHKKKLSDLWCALFGW